MNKRTTSSSIQLIGDSPDLVGKDEMNLAEFPLTKLGSRDRRDVLTHKGWVKEKHRRAYRQVWTVRGATGLGLPNELGDRVILALIALNVQQDTRARKVEFSRYQLLKIMGLDPQGSNLYDKLELVLRQLAGITIESERAFYDKAQSKRLTSREAFHLIDKLWLRKYETDADTLADEDAHGYIVWSGEIWNSLQAGYIKNLDLDFYYSLPSPLARRLYRFLDKRMRHRNQMEIDVFELSSRLGQSRYRKPSETYRKLKPGVQQLIERKFLASADVVKRQKYTRIRFVKATDADRRQQHTRHVQQTERWQELRQQYKTSAHEEQIWQAVLAELNTQLTPVCFSMVADAQLLSMNEGSALLCSPNAFGVEWLKKNSATMQILRKTLAEQSGECNIALRLVDLKSAPHVSDC